MADPEYHWRNRYRHLEELGAGASGRVLAVEDILREERRALKVVPESALGRLFREFGFLSKIRSPHLPRVFELQLVDEQVPEPFSFSSGAGVLVEELIEGEPALRTCALVSGNRRTQLAFQLVADALVALRELHAAGVVHGDVKPANLLASSGRGVLIDFDLAGPNTELDHVVRGTPGYIAPEAWQGTRSPQTDFYALGVTLIALLFGESVLASSESASIELRNAHELPKFSAMAPPSLARLSSLGLGEATWRLLRALLAIAPEGRPESAASALELFETIARTEGLTLVLPARGLESAGPREKLLRVANLPFVGNEAQLHVLSNHFLAEGEPEPIMVTGPEGSGRDRFVREAAGRAQSEAFRERLRVPHFLELPPNAIIPSLSADTIVYAPHLHSQADLWRAMGSLSLEGARVWLVGKALSKPSEGTSIELSPLDRDHFEALGAKLVETGDALDQDALFEACAGLPGLAVEIVERGLATGNARVALEISRTTSTTSRGLAFHLLALGGQVPVAELLAAGFDGAELSAALREGVASERGRTFILRSSIAFSQSEISDALALARTLEGSESPRARAFQDLASGDSVPLTRRVLESLRDGDAREAAELCRGWIERVPSLDAHLLLFQALRRLGRYTELIAYAESWLDTERWEHSVVAEYAEALRRLGRVSDAKEVLRRSGFDSRFVPKNGAERAALATLAWILLAEGEAEAMRVAERSEDLAVIAWGRLSAGDGAGAEDALAGLSIAPIRPLGRPTLESETRRVARARSLSVRGSLHKMAGRLAAAASDQAEVLRSARALGDGPLVASAETNLASLKWDRGDLGGGLAAMRHAAAQYLELGQDREASRALANLAWARSFLGQVDLSRSAIHAARSALKRQADSSATALLWLSEISNARRLGGASLEALVAHVPSGDQPAGAMVRAHAASLLAASEPLLAKRLLKDVPSATASAHGRGRDALARARFSLRAEGTAELPELARVALQKSFEGALELAFWDSEVAERTRDEAKARAALSQVRRLLDDASQTLGLSDRYSLRALPEFARALTAPRIEARAKESSANVRLHLRWRKLASLTRTLVTERSAKRLRKTLLDAALELVDGERALLIRRGEDGQYHVMAERSLYRDGPTQNTFSRSVVSRTLEDGVVSTRNALEDEDLSGAASVVAQSLRSIACVSLRWDASVLYLEDRRRPAAFAETELEILSELAELVTLALTRAEQDAHVKTQSRELIKLRQELADRVRRQEHELGRLREPKEDRTIARSVAMRSAYDLAARLAESELPILIQGPPGAGKEHLADWMHRRSVRRSGPLFVESCGGLEGSLLESRLFGHQRGAFTGAEENRAGVFELAAGGTLVLDGVESLSASAQAKLLRVIQTRRIRPLGSERERDIDVRLMATTQTDLRKLVREGHFREDLFFRIAVAKLDVPPLSERLADIPELVHLLLSEAAIAEGRDPPRMADSAMRSLLQRSFPGNVRELENVLRRATVLADDVILPEHLGARVSLESLDLKARVGALEKELIDEALRQTEGNITRAAKMLGLSRYGLQKKLAARKKTEPSP